VSQNLSLADNISKKKKTCQPLHCRKTGKLKKEINARSFIQREKTNRILVLNDANQENQLSNKQ
jgi:hypothetical protein